MTEPNNVPGRAMEDHDRPENAESPVSSLTGDNWENRADDILGESSFDTELGKKMSRDAIRVSRGKMSDEEFYDKYHEDVVAEFGRDDRPATSEDSV